MTCRPGFYDSQILTYLACWGYPSLAYLSPSVGLYVTRLPDDSPLRRDLPLIDRTGSEDSQPLPPECPQTGSRAYESTMRTNHFSLSLSWTAKKEKSWAHNSDTANGHSTCHGAVIVSC